MRHRRSRDSLFGFGFVLKCKFNECVCSIGSPSQAGCSFSFHTVDVSCFWKVLLGCRHMSFREGQCHVVDCFVFILSQDAVKGVSLCVLGLLTFVPS